MGIIRILLALFVVLYHCGQFKILRLMQGPEAVQSFYIISGFYMALILNEKYVNQSNAYRLFITNRLLKLMPIYWLMLLIIAVISFVLIIKTNGNDWGFFHVYKKQTLHIGACLYLSFTNLFIIGQDVSLFMGVNSENGSLLFSSFYEQSKPPLYILMLVPQAWTISIEIMFYLIAPFFVRKKIWVITLLALLALSIKIILFQNGLNYDPWSYRFFPAELFLFLLGVLAYKLYAITKGVLVSKWIMIVCFVTTLIVIILFDVLMLQFHQYIYFLCFSLSIPLIFRLTTKSKIDKIIGEYSYPIYISHVFFKSIYFMLFGFSENVSIPVMLASITFALLYNQFVNPKFEDYRQHRVIAN